MSHVDYALHESSLGYAVFRVVHQTDGIALRLKETREAVSDLSRFGKMVQLVNFSPFQCVLLPTAPPRALLLSSKRGAHTDF
jgi:nucleolar protein 56